MVNTRSTHRQLSGRHTDEAPATTSQWHETRSSFGHSFVARPARLPWRRPSAVALLALDHLPDEPAAALTYDDLVELVDEYKAGSAG